MFTKDVIKHTSTAASLFLKIARSVSQFFDFKYWLIKKKTLDQMYFNH